MLHWGSLLARRSTPTLCERPDASARIDDDSIDVVRGHVRVRDRGTTWYLARGGEKIARWCATHAGELFVRGVFAAALDGRCRGERGTIDVLDIGANYGYYGVGAAARGCSVLAFEPQPACAPAIRAALRESNVAVDALYTLVEAPVAYPPRTLLIANASACVGQWPASLLSYQRPRGVATDAIVDAAYAGIGADAVVDALRDAGGGRVVRSVDASALVGAARHVRLAKIDTEGNELAVLASLLPLAIERRLDNVVVELSYGAWPRLGVARAHVRATLVAYIDAAHFVALPLRHGTLRPLASGAALAAWLDERAAEPGADGQVDVWLARTLAPRDMVRALVDDARVCAPTK